MRCSAGLCIQTAINDSPYCVTHFCTDCEPWYFICPVIYGVYRAGITEYHAGTDRSSICVHSDRSCRASIGDYKHIPRSGKCNNSAVCAGLCVFCSSGQMCIGCMRRIRTRWKYCFKCCVDRICKRCQSEFGSVGGALYCEDCTKSKSWCRSCLREGLSRRDEIINGGTHCAYCVLYPTFRQLLCQWREKSVQLLEWASRVHPDAETLLEYSMWVWSTRPDTDKVTGHKLYLWHTDASYQVAHMMVGHQIYSRFKPPAWTSALVWLARCPKDVFFKVLSFI